MLDKKASENLFNMPDISSKVFRGLSFCVRKVKLERLRGVNVLPYASLALHGFSVCTRNFTGWVEETVVGEVAF